MVLHSMIRPLVSQRYFVYSRQYLLIAVNVTRKVKLLVTVTVTSNAEVEAAAPPIAELASEAVGAGASLLLILFTAVVVRVCVTVAVEYAVTAHPAMVDSRMKAEVDTLACCCSKSFHNQLLQFSIIGMFLTIVLKSSSERAWNCQETDSEGSFCSIDKYVETCNE